ncbi:hypothetical protein SLS61_001920 [Didymella pomorum]
MPSMFGSMPFKYGKVSDESSTDDESQTYPGPGRVTSWIRLCNFAFKLRWPSTLFLLFVILAAQVQILHRQPAAMPVGGEINGIVPHFDTSQKKFLKDTRYNSDHKTPASMATTKANWLALAPRGGGMLNLPDYARHTLPPPMHYDEFPQLKDKDTNAIMCMADATLEGQIEGDGWDGETGTDGTGAMHVCRNWDEVVRWAEGKRLYDVAHL